VSSDLLRLRPPPLRCSHSPFGCAISNTCPVRPPPSYGRLVPTHTSSRFWCLQNETLGGRRENPMFLVSHTVLGCLEFLEGRPFFFHKSFMLRSPPLVFDPSLLVLDHPPPFFVGSVYGRPTTGYNRPSFATLSSRGCVSSLLFGFDNSPPTPDWWGDGLSCFSKQLARHLVATATLGNAFLSFGPVYYDGFWKTVLLLGPLCPPVSDPFYVPRASPVSLFFSKFFFFFLGL